MDLSTTYLGLKLRTPLMASASPLILKNDNIKLMKDAGAAAAVDVAMLCSVLLRHAIEHLCYLETEITAWLEQHHYQSLSQIKGVMNPKNCPDPSAFARAQSVDALSTYEPLFLMRRE